MYSYLSIYICTLSKLAYFLLKVWMSSACFNFDGDLKLYNNIYFVVLSLSVYLYVCLSICLPTYLSVYSYCLYIYQSICLSVYLPIYHSINIPIYHSINLPIYHSTLLSFCQSDPYPLPQARQNSSRAMTMVRSGSISRGR